MNSELKTLVLDNLNPDCLISVSTVDIFFLLKGSDRLCKVVAVELSMQSCGQILQDSIETYETVTRSINPEFERKVDVQT